MEISLSGWASCASGESLRDGAVLPALSSRLGTTRRRGGRAAGCPVPPRRGGSPRSFACARAGAVPVLRLLQVPQIQGGKKSERLFLPVAEARVQRAKRGLGGRVDSLKAWVGPC